MNIYVDLKKMHGDAAISYPENRLYCLVDHAGMPGLHRELELNGVPWSSLFEGSRESNALLVAPLLLELDHEVKKDHSIFLQWLAEHGTYTSSMLLLSSPLSLAAVKGRLVRRLQARVSEQMDVLLRYYDPRTFEGLLSVLSASERVAFLDVADCWWYFDRSGMAIQQTASCQAADSFESPLVLTEKQEFALLDASEPDQVAEQLRTMLPQQFLRLPLPKRHAFIVRHMAAAAEVGVRGTQQLALYCGLAMLHGENFSCEPQWQLVLERVRFGNITLSDAVAKRESEVVSAV